MVALINSPDLPTLAPEQEFTGDAATLNERLAAFQDEQFALRTLAQRQAQQQQLDIINSQVQAQQLQAQADLARSLVTPQVDMNALINASAPLAISQPTQVPATFNADTRLAQALAPAPDVPGVLPSLLRTTDNNLSNARVDRGLAEEEVRRLQTVQDQAMQAFIDGPALEIMLRPRDQ